MITISILSVGDNSMSKFDVTAEHADECVKRLRHPDEVLFFRTRSDDATAYIPVRNITYMRVSDDHNPADPNFY